jgi:Ca2+-binding RTX toxin-like protein
MANIRGTAGNDSLTGTSVDDLIEGLAGNDTLMGLAGNDTLDAGTGGDLLIGGSGNDTYIVDGPGDSIRENAGEGTDTVRSSATRSLEDNVENLVLTGTAAINGTGNALNNVITGNSASNFLVGGSGNDTLDGGAGDDTLDGTAGGELLIGGTGNDLFFVDGPGDTVRENAGEGTDTIQSTASRTLDANVENLRLAAVGTTPINGTGNALNNAINGTDGANVLSGLAGNDTLNGFAGNDTLDAGTGGDLLAGGTGEDTYILDGPGDTVRESPGEGNDTIRSSATRILDANVENLVLTGTAAINGTGNQLGNGITGNSAANYLSGLDGNDALRGGGGDDTLDGGTGDDFYDLVGGGTNTINDAGGVDSIFTDQRQLTLPSDIENAEIREPLQAGTGNAVLTGNGLANHLTYTGVDDARIEGLGGDDTIFGDEGDDTLNGGDGNDSIIGDFGDDTLRGGAGVDTLSGHEGDDSYFVTAGDFATEGASDDGSDIDTVFSPVSWTLGPDFENLTFSTDGAAGNIAGVEGIGNERNNALDGRIVDRVRLEGRAGNDSLLGGAAADTLLGGTGNDVLSGGGGADSFTFAEAPGSANADRITDFTSGADKLALDDAFHAGIGAPGNFSAGDERFFAGAGATGGQDASDRVIYDTTAGAVYFDADGNGAGAAQLIATLQASPAIAATDIAVI